MSNNRKVFQIAGDTVHNKKIKQKISNEVLCAEYEAVFHYVLSLCKNETQAQDITQETFLKAMKSSDKFEGASSLYTWLCAIAKNLWLNDCKKLNRIIPSETVVDTDNAVKSVEQTVLEKDEAFRIHILLHQLQEPYKEVFSLRVFGQLPFADIASLFAKSESWARVTFYRAKKMIIEQAKGEIHNE